MSYKMDFIKHRRKFYILSTAILLLGLLSLLIRGLNLGVDFSSGTRLDIYLGQTFDQQEVRRELTELGYNPGSIVTAGDQNDRAVARFTETIGPDQVNEIREAFAERYGDQVELVENKVDPSYSRELVKKAIYAVLIASLAIVLYVTIRFEFRFAVAAILALAHDAFAVIAVFSLFQMEVNLPFIAAVLTIIGYSINDTIVLFDRIREHLRLDKIKTKADLADSVNASLNETLTRSINTVLTVVFAAAALLILGGASIRVFAMAMTVGLIAGAYSSIFIASQIWYDWKGSDIEKKRFDSQANKES